VTDDILITARLPNDLSMGSNLRKNI